MAIKLPLSPPPKRRPPPPPTPPPPGEMPTEAEQKAAAIRAAKEIHAQEVAAAERAKQAATQWASEQAAKRAAEEAAAAAQRAAKEAAQQAAATAQALLFAAEQAQQEGRLDAAEAALRHAERVAAAAATAAQAAGVTVPAVIPREWLLRVDPAWGARQTEGVIKIGGDYYRPSLPTAEFQAALQSGKTQEQIFAEALAVMQAPTLTAQLELLQETGAVIPAYLRSQIDRAQRSLEGLTGEAQFKKAVELGFVPEGSIYISKDTYLPAPAVEEIKAAAPELHEILITEGWEAYQAAVEVEQEKFENELKEISPELYRVYKERGWEAYQAAVERELGAYQEALDELKPFETLPFTESQLEYGAQEVERWAGKPVSSEEYRRLFTGYDLMAAIKAGHLKEVELLFPPETVQVAQDAIEAEEKAVALEVARAALDKHWYQGTIITEAERINLIETWRNESARIDRLLREAETVEERVALVEERRALGVSPEFIGFSKATPALILPVDPIWQTLKDRPKDDPERIAYLEKWGETVADAVAFAALAVTPWTAGAISALGMRLLPPIFSGAMRAGSFITTGGVSLARLPVLNAIPRVATQLVVGLTKLAVLPAPPAYIAARVIDDKNARDLQANWQAFEALSMADKDKCAIEAGYPGYDKLTDPQKAVVLLYYAAPSKKTLDTWLEGIGSSVERLHEIAAKGSEWLDEHAPAPIAMPVKFATGIVAGAAEGVHYMAALPLLTANLVDKAPRGEAKDFAVQVATGMAEFFTAIPALWMAAPAYQTGRLTGLFLLSPRALIKLGQGFGYNITPTHIKGYSRAIAIEFTTVKVPHIARATTAQMLTLGESLIRQLVEGKTEAVAKLGDFVVKIRNVPYQIGKPGRYWHFTTDIAKFPKGESVTLGTRRLHLSPQAAKRFAITSAFGEPMRRPGLIELVVSEKYQPNLYKTLSGGRVEIETAIRNRTLDYVGKGKGYDVKLGTYPIHRYLLRGDIVKPEALRLSPREFARIQALTIKEITLDMILGWHGRARRLRAMFAKDPRVKRIESQIEELKQQQPEVVAKDGTVTSIRQPFPHPSRSGTVRVSTYGIVRRPGTRPKTFEILLTRDKMDPASMYSPVGGRYNPIGGRGKLTGTRIRTFEGGWADQVLSETALNLRNIKLLDIYLGKVTPHAMSGSRIFLAKVTRGARIDLSRYQPRGKTELVEARWWDGKSEITVSPAFYDVLARVAKRYGLDMSKVKVYRGDTLLLKARDANFARRTEPLDPAKIKNINETEIKMLRRELAEITRGRAPELADYILAEPDFAGIFELIMGKRQALRVSKNKISPSAIRALQEHPSLVTRTAAELVNKQRQGRPLTKVELEQYLEAVNRAFEKQRQKLQEAFDNAYDYVQRHYPHEYSRAYTYYMRALVAALERYRPAMGKRVDYARATLAERRSPVAIRVEPYKPASHEQPRVYDEPVYIPTKYVEPTYKPPPRKPSPYKPPPYKPPPYKPPPYKPPPSKPPPRVPPPRVPPPPPPPRVPPPPPPPKLTSAERKRRRQEFAGAICWRQGALGRPPKSVWWAIKAPYASQEDVDTFIGEPPPNARIVKGGVKSAYRSIQDITGKAPEKLAVDLGIMDIIISGPSKKPGKPGAIRFKKDVEQKTTGDITIGPRRPSVIKGTVVEPLVTSPPIESSRMPASVAAAIGSYRGKVTPEGKVIIKVRRL